MCRLAEHKPVPTPTLLWLAWTTGVACLLHVSVSAHPMIIFLLAWLGLVTKYPGCATKHHCSPDHLPQSPQCLAEIWQNKCARLWSEEPNMETFQASLDLVYSQSMNSTLCSVMSGSQLEPVCGGDQCLLLMHIDSSTVPVYKQVLRALRHI